MTRVAGVRVMSVQASGHSLRFADRVARILERVEHRPAISQADREAAYRLRYEAYLRQNLLDQRLDAMLYDEVYDKSPNSLTTMTYIEGELASTVRVHVVSEEAAVSPALDVFPDVLAPRLRGGASLSTRRALQRAPTWPGDFRSCRISPSARRGWRRTTSTLTSSL